MDKMLWLFDRLVYVPVFKLILIIFSIFARSNQLRITKICIRMCARVALSLRLAKFKEDIVEVGIEWKRMFPHERMQRFISKDDDTVFYETHTWCPLRGTGEVLACYHLMEFDRCLCEKIGGRFVVLKSQAVPGRKTCIIAIRKPGKTISDLIPAHKRDYL